MFMLNWPRRALSANLSTFHLSDMIALHSVLNRVMLVTESLVGGEMAEATVAQMKELGEAQRCFSTFFKILF